MAGAGPGGAANVQQAHAHDEGAPHAAAGAAAEEDADGDLPIVDAEEEEHNTDGSGSDSGSEEDDSGSGSDGASSSDGGDADGDALDGDEGDEDDVLEEEDDEEPFGGEPSASWAVKDPVEDAGLGQHGCDHYKRRCRLVSPCCGEVFWCRHCHNAAKDDGEQDLAKRHALDRKQVTEVECALCATRQPVAETCSSCGVRFGRYSCLKCNFFDDNTAKKQFHCEECGICRVGGRENFFHCNTCNCCYSLALQESHVCVQNSMHQNCPVCFEYLFDSVRPITVLPCGHTIHQECYHSLVTHDSMSLCPICMRCTLNPVHRERMWRDVDVMIAQNPMPQEHAGRRVAVLCNDCQVRSADVAFHFIGNKCGSCGGYNTRMVD